MTQVKSYTLNCDGASRGNPGPAAAGAIIKDANSGETLEEISEFLGSFTNNVAEYQSLILGLQAVLDVSERENSRPTLEIRMDSELVVKQILGIYRVKKEDLKPLHKKCMELLKKIQTWKISHVPRAQNADADRLANQAYEI